MSEIVLVTQNDEPALAFGEYEISADGNTMYVGSAGVSDGSSEVIYKGISPAKVKYGVLSRLQTISDSVVNDTSVKIGVTHYRFSDTPITSNNVSHNVSNNIIVREEFSLT